MANMQTQSQEQNAYRYQKDNSGDIGVDIMFREIETTDVREQFCYDLLSTLHKMHCHDNFYNFSDGVWVNYGVLAMADAVKQQWWKILKLRDGPLERKGESPYAANQRKSSLSFIQKTQSVDEEPSMGGVLQRFNWWSSTLNKSKMPQAAKKITPERMKFMESRVDNLGKQLESISLRIEEAEQNYGWMKKAYKSINNDIEYAPFKPSTPDPEVPKMTSEQLGISSKAVEIMARNLVE